MSNISYRNYPPSPSKLVNNNYYYYEFKLEILLEIRGRGVRATQFLKS